MHTLLDLRGIIPSFIHISDGKLLDVHALDMLLPEAGAIYVVDRGITSTLPAFMCCTKPGPSSSRAPSRNIDAHRVYSAPTDRSTGIICDQTISLARLLHPSDYPELLRRIRFKDPESGKTLVFITRQLLASGRHHLRALQKPLASGTLLQVDQAASSDQAVLRHVGERGEDADHGLPSRSTSSSPSSS